MTTTRHSGDHLRYLVDGPAGTIEVRIRPDTAFVIHHQPGCDAEHCTDQCDAEITPGMGVAALYRLGGDQAVWSALAEYALRAELATIPQPPHELSAEAAEFAAQCRASAEWVATVDLGPGPYFLKGGF